MLETYEKNPKRKLVVTVLTIIVIAGTIILADHFKSQSLKTSSASQTVTVTPAVVPATTNPPATTATTPTPTAATVPPASSSGYKDGSYTASSDYYVPHGNETIGVSLVVTNGVITKASIQNSENDNQSARYQEDFAAEFKNYVVSKKISGLRLGVIAGASDTTQGFNDALSRISSKAHV